MFVFKVDGRFVCWNSFKSLWFLGPMRLSEVFYADFSAGARNGEYLRPRAREVFEDLFPTATIQWLREES